MQLPGGLRFIGGLPYTAVADFTIETKGKTPGEILGGLMEVAVSP